MTSIFDVSYCNKCRQYYTFRVGETLMMCGHEIEERTEDAML